MRKLTIVTDGRISILTINHCLIEKHMEVLDMALEVVSGSVYQNSSKPLQKTEYKANEVNSSEAEPININVTEITATVKTSGNNLSGNEQETGQKDGKASEKQIKDAISRANSKLKSHRTRCEFSYHEETKRVSIKVLDEETEEVIREIPPEETLEMVERMWELAGLLIDERR